MQFFSSLWNNIKSLISEEGGQDAVEYLLIVGGLSVALVVAAIVLADSGGDIVTAVCDAIQTVDNFGTMPDC